MKKVISLFILCITIISCKEEAVPKPDNLLSKEKMAEILYDITLINAAKGVDNKKLEESYMHLDAYVYQKHQIDSLQFLVSNNYYAANPLIYDEIYGIVQAKLTKERKAIGKEIELEQKRRDSIQDAKKIARKERNNDSITEKKPKFKQAKKQ
ncbi:DUF4296 domain-containing protein [Kordia zhangzhouensis]|uniref:DUF4296 domain-containing protein n=1 Tax=Kordia zhangzhouensis TaxID=1620405 RepID=UPI00069C07B3|nr:DUF4296 domain-containing protein [Kordia zhangzhouensis]